MRIHTKQRMFAGLLLFHRKNKKDVLSQVRL